MDIKLNKNIFVKKMIFTFPFLICFFIQLSKINNDIVNFSEAWMILSPFSFLEAMAAGHTPFYYYLVRFFQIFNVFNIAPYAHLRFINCLFNIVALAYIYKTFKEIFNHRTAFWTIFCLSLGSFFLETTVTTIRYPLVNFLFFFSLYNFLMYLRTKSNRYFFIFVVSELIVTSLDAHAVFGCLFKVIYILVYRIRIDRKLINTAILLGINFFIINFSIYIMALHSLKSNVGWLAALNNLNYFVDRFIPNFFFNTETFKFPMFTWISFIILFCFSIFILVKIHDQRVRVITLFLLVCFLLLGLAQYATRLQYFMVKYFISLTPFILSLFFYVMPERKKILPYLFCAFIGYNTVIAYPTMCASGYSYIFRAIEKYKPTACISLYKFGFVPKTVVSSLYPSIQIKPVKYVNSNSFYSDKTVLLVSRYKSKYFYKHRNEILNTVLFGHTKVLDYYYNDCPGFISVYLMYNR